MIFRLIILILLCSACRVNDMRCPEVKVVKLNKRPSNYGLRPNEKLSASNRLESKETYRVKQRPVKSAASIEEWDCPRPGTRTSMPKAVRENIRKNKKKFDTYYRNRNFADSVMTSPAASKSRK